MAAYSHSKLAAFESCPRAYKFAYIERPEHLFTFFLLIKDLHPKALLTKSILLIKSDGYT